MIQAVIGTGFGDEGKGLTTDYLVSQAGPDTTVVRFNGGAQAGHTVVTPEGKKHVFGHIGSGHLCYPESRTFLSKYFIVNPILLVQEIETFEKNIGQFLGQVLVDKNCIVTTPMDMVYNILLEKHRGRERHGSCGSGINATVDRNDKVSLTADDLVSESTVTSKYREIIQHYQTKIVEEGLETTFRSMDPHYKLILVEKSLDRRFLKTVWDYRKIVSLCDGIKSVWGNLIFEGAQGLLLDQDCTFFPHVTRSKTGLMNVAKLARELGETQIDVTYVTRAYHTRHGAGPLPHEVKGKVYDGIEDDTNIPNEHQGALRFAPLVLDLVRNHMILDAMKAYDRFLGDIDSHFMITCMDQVPSEMQIVINGNIITVKKKNIKEVVDRQIPYNGKLLLCSGRTRNDITRIS